MTRQSSKPPLQIPMTLLQELSGRSPQCTQFHVMFADFLPPLHFVMRFILKSMGFSVKKNTFSNEEGQSRSKSFASNLLSPQKSHHGTSVIHKQHQTTYIESYLWTNLVFAIAGLPFNQSDIHVQTSEDPNFNRHLWAVFKLALKQDSED